MGCGASSATAPDNTQVVQVTVSDTRRSGMLLDCGSGHTSILWYGLTSGNRPIRQLRRSKLKLPTGGNFKLTDIFIGDPAARDQCIAVFGSALVAEIDEATPTTGHPVVVYVGATGGLREQLQLGIVTNEDVEYLRAQLVNQIPQLVLAVVSGEQEASWELSAAHAIYQPLAGIMFPSISPPVEFGLFSGGGSSMQGGYAAVAMGVLKYIVNICCAVLLASASGCVPCSCFCCSILLTSRSSLWCSLGLLGASSLR